MYIPKHFVTTDRTEIVAFMQQYSFGTIITSVNNIPVASHLPFLVTVKGNDVILTSHFAKANEQWKHINTSQCLVIFSEPHAYISPKHYDKELTVPTWNYFSVHAYGEGKIISGVAGAYEVLEATIDNYERDYKQQWQSMPEDFKLKMIKGIVAFEIVVTDLQAKKKLSQNKSGAEQDRIIQTLSESSHTSEQDIAKYMAQNRQAVP